MTVLDIRTKYRSELNSFYEEDELNEIISLAFESVKGFTKTDLTLKTDEPVNAEEQKRFDYVLSELKTGKPIQYILGYAWFYGMKFFVDEHVLIPRPETEELVRWIIEEDGNQKSGIRNLLDIGTGSGCIAVALNKKLPFVNVDALDVSDNALSVAKKNAELNHVQVTFILADVFHINPSAINKQYNVIVSNPPYVLHSDKPSLHERVLKYEPHLALFADEKDALIYYRAIGDFALLNLSKDGALFLEIHHQKANEVCELLQTKGFRDVEVRKDMSGKDRMVKAIR
jgi:release factor glutamine methyltransferase